MISKMMLWNFAALVFLLSAVKYNKGEEIPNIHDLLNVGSCGKSSVHLENPDRIIGGDKVRHGKYPWMVALYERYVFWGSADDYSYKCGGAILNESWIVTAASCFQKPQQYWNYWIYTGLYKLSEVDGPTVQRHKVSKIIVHESYMSYYPNKDNIALVKLQKPINFAGSGGYVNAICLPESIKEPAGFATVTGWGKTQNIWTSDADALMEVTVPIIPQSKCESNYYNNICAGNKFKNFCDGDSGSPLIQRDYDSVATLIGLAASRTCRTDSDSPGKYTRVSTYLDWMAEVISKN